MPSTGYEEKDMPEFSPSQPREKWIKKRTSVKLKVIPTQEVINFFFKCLMVTQIKLY